MHHDLRHAFRTLKKRPGFTAIAVVTLAVGIGATTTIFTLLDAIVLQPLPYPQAERLVALRHTAPGMGIGEAGQSDGTYHHYRRSNRAFDEIGAYIENVVNVTGVDEPERVHVALVTPSLFEVLRVVTARGRLFTEEEGRAERSNVVILSHGLWQRRYGADPRIVGRTIELNEGQRTVVGVMPPGFEFPRRDTDVWYPLDGINAYRPTFAGFYVDAIARLRPDVTVSDAQADMRRMIDLLPEVLPDVTPEELRDAGFQAVIVPLKRAVVGDVASALWVLLGGVAVLLVIACANVANLFLVRAEHRQRELLMRLALGARQGDVGRTLLAEALLLAGAGGLLGVALADAGVTLMAALDIDLPRLHHVAVGARSLGFAAALTVLSAFVLPLAPFIRYRRVDLGSALAVSAPGGERPERHILRRGLVSLQIALALTLLVGSALMVRTFWRLSRIDPGFDPRGVLTVELALPFSPYPTYEAAAGFHDRVMTRVRALPGVVAVGGASPLPLTPLPSYYRVAVTTGPAMPDSIAVPVLRSLATPDYFSVMRIPVVEGRVFDADDLHNAEHPVVVNRALARHYYPGTTAVGRPIELHGAAFTIVGVVENVQQETMTTPAPPTLFLPVLPGGQPDWIPYRPDHLTLTIRAEVPPTTLAPPVRQIVREIDPDVPIANVRTLESIVRGATARTTLTMLLLLVAALAALFLGAVGAYGVMAYMVTRRTREIGLRIALGARANVVTRMVLRQATTVAVVGLVVGTLAALSLTWLLRGLLFGVTPTDPFSFAATALLLLGATLLASWLPARRAARIDPMEALRHE